MVVSSSCDYATHALKRIFLAASWTQGRECPKIQLLYSFHAFLGGEWTGLYWTGRQESFLLLVVASKPNTDSRETVFNQLQVVVLLYTARDRR